MNHGEINISDENHQLTAVFIGSFNTAVVIDYANRIKLIVACYKD